MCTFARHTQTHTHTHTQHSETHSFISLHNLSLSPSLSLSLSLFKTEVFDTLSQERKFSNQRKFILELTLLSFCIQLTTTHSKGTRPFFFYFTSTSPIIFKKPLNPANHRNAAIVKLHLITYIHPFQRTCSVQSGVCIPIILCLIDMRVQHVECICLHFISINLAHSLARSLYFKIISIPLSQLSRNDKRQSLIQTLQVL